MKFKSGFVTVVGKPNVGKSTLINGFLGEKIAITSPKPQTTRTNLNAIITNKNAQIIFIDTPGIHTPKNKLGEYMIDVAKGTFSEVDVILFLCDATDKTVTQSDLRIIDNLRLVQNKPIILVINKVDAVPKETILEKIEILSQKMNFASVFPVSALKNDGLDDLIGEIEKFLPEGPKYYPDDILTDTNLRDIVSDIIREKILLFYRDEVPHGIAVEIVKFDEARKASGVTSIEVNIICEKNSHKAILIGKGGTMLKKIGSKARVDIEKILDCKVNLQLWVKVREDWRNNSGILKELGYKK